MQKTNTQCGQECGQPVSLIAPFSFPKNKKILENQWFSRIQCGGDKRDRTADLLNAMSAIRGENEYKCNL